MMHEIIFQIQQKKEIISQKRNIYLILLINGQNISAEERSFTACTFIEGIIKFSISCPEWMIHGVKPNADRRSTDVEQVVLIVKVPANSQIQDTKDHW